MPIDPVTGVVIAKSGIDILSNIFGGKEKEKENGTPGWLPWLPAGVGALSAASRFLSPDRASQIYGEVLQNRQENYNRIQRQAFGNFSAQDRERIKAAAEPQVNQVAGTVARRGLGGSGAGAQIIAGAQQAPFTAAQQSAMAALPEYEAAVLDTAKSLKGDGSFFSDIQEIASLLVQEYEADPEGTSQDPEFTGLAQWFYKIAMGMS